MPTLYLVGTPIGNMEDISLRALRTLREVDLIAAEDTRITRRLLERYEIDTRLVSFHEYSGPGRVKGLLSTLENGDMALVSDAGMPGLSDPGYPMIEACIQAGIDIVPIPGPSAPITALVTSGLPAENFLFLGFLPRKQKARREALAEIAGLPFTIILFEAPHRLLSLLDDLIEILGNRRISIGREMTKFHEEIWRGSTKEAVDYFESVQIRGEFTLAIAGAAEGQWDEADVMAALSSELGHGASRKKASEVVARLSGWKKRDLYKLSLTLDKD